MSEHALHLPTSSHLLTPAPSRMMPAPAAAVSDAIVSLPAEGELSDDDLEHVVGGLARAWFV